MLYTPSKRAAPSHASFRLGGPSLPIPRNYLDHPLSVLRMESLLGEVLLPSLAACPCAYRRRRAAVIAGASSSLGRQYPL